MNRSCSASSTLSTERSPLLYPADGKRPSADLSRSSSPVYTESPQTTTASTVLQPASTSTRTRRPSNTVRPLLPTRNSSTIPDLETQHTGEGVVDVNAHAHARPSKGKNRYTPDPKQYAADHEPGHEQDALATTASTADDADIEAASSTSFLPFPRQRHPSKALRPDHYTVRRSLDKFRKFVHRNHGLCLLACSQLFFSTMNLFYKLLNSLPADENPQITALEIIFIRMSITWVGCVGFMLASGVENPILGPKGVRRLLALRGFSGFFGLFGLYYSLQYLSLSDATVITFLAPLATGFLGYLVLGERFTLREIIGGIISLGGVVLIARPAFIFGRKVADEDLDGHVAPDASAFVPVVGGGNGTAPSLVHEVLRRSLVLLVRAIGEVDAATTMGGAVNATQTPGLHVENGPHPVTEAERLLAVGLALLGICGAAGAYISIRAIGHRASATHSVAYFSLYSTIVSAFLMWYTDTAFVLPNSAKWCSLLVCIGVFGLLAQILLALGLQREKAGRASTAVYLQIVFASLYQLFILHVPINALSGVGMAIILCAAVWIAIAKE